VLDAVRRDPGRLAGNAARRLAAALVCYPPYNRSYEAGALAFKSALFVLPTLGLLIVLVAWLRGRAAGAEKLAAVLYLASWRVSKRAAPAAPSSVGGS
jgi:hypothetical protein